MIGYILAAGAILIVARKMNRKPGLTETNPQPVPLTPAPNTVGLVVAGAQPQLEQSRGAIVSASVPYQPATTMVPDIGQLKQVAGPVTNTDPTLIANTAPATPAPLEKKLEDTQIVGSILAMGGSLSEAIL